MPKERPRGADTRPGPPRAGSGKWQTAITRLEPNKVLLRGFPIDELMGRVHFAEAIYLVLTGELPSPAHGKMLGAILVSSIDHGATPPSTLVARHIATTGAPLRNAVAAGVLAFGEYHGGDVEACMRLLERGLELVRAGASHEEAALAIVQERRVAGERPPGFGHRLHARDPRAHRLLQLAMELEIDDEHCRLIRWVERVIAERAKVDGEALPLNVDGAIAAICADMGLSAAIGNALFIIARVPGLTAHALEERQRQRPMRQIDPKDHEYDGPRDRRLPETRK